MAGRGFNVYKGPDNHMSTSSNKQQKKGEDGMGKAGKRKEMVKDRRVQKMYVEGRCVKGVYAIVRKSEVYVR